MPTDLGSAALRKASWRLLPILGFGYAAALIDRTNLSFAALQMNHDLGFSASVYGFGAGIFFLSYATCNVPANLLLQRFGARRWLAAIMVVWGILSCGMAFIRTPIPFYTLRFLLGVAEAGFFPGVIYYLTCWFPPAVRARTITRWYVFGPLSMTVSGALAGMLLGLGGRLNLAGWQWLFLTEAAPAILLGVLIFAWLPDGPDSAAWLSPEERSWLKASLGREAGARAPSAVTQIAQTFCNRTVWHAGSFMFCAMFSFYSYVFFAPVVIKGLTGLDNGQVGWIFAGQFFLGAVAMIANGILSDRKKERYLHSLVPMALMAAGFLLAGLSRSPWIALPALTVVPICAWAGQGPSWAACAGMMEGDSAAAGIAAMTALGICGGFVGPYAMGFVKDHAGGFQAGLLMCAAVAFASVLIMRTLKAKFLAVKI